MKKVRRLILLASFAAAVAVATPSYAAPDASPKADAAATQPAAAPTATAPAPAPAAQPAPAPQPAPAAEGGTQAWWQGLLVTVIEAAVAILMPILSVLIMLLIRKWKLKVEQDQVDWILGKAVGFAEQKARNALKDGKPMEGPELFKIAHEHGSSLLAKYKLPSKLGDYLGDLIEAKLGQEKLAGPETPKPPNGNGAEPSETPA